MEVKPDGGSVRPEPDARASTAIFVVEGEGKITNDGRDYPLRTGSFAYLPAGAKSVLRNESAVPIQFHWVRKAFKVVDGLELPPAIVSHEDDCVMHAMPDTEGRWAATRFIDPSDIRYEMHLNIVTLSPAPSFPSWKRTSWSTGSMCSRARPSIG